LRIERDHVVRKELERVQALAARQRVAGCGEAAAEQSDPPVGILVQEAHANVEYRATEDAIAELSSELSRRQSGGGANPPPLFLMIYGLQRYRGLRKQEDSFGFGSGDEEKKPQTDKQFTENRSERPG